MRNLFLIFGIIFLFSCTQEKRQNSTPVQATKQKPEIIYQINKIQMKWTAYKTTARIPVSGTFKQIEWKNLQQASSPVECVKNLYFKINTSSIFTDNPERDKTLYEYLFGQMLEGNFIEGRVAEVDKKNHRIRTVIRMNGLEKSLEFPYQMNDSVMHASVNIDLEKDFMAGEALYFLHTACKDKHTGEDGISKTWPDVKLETEIHFSQIENQHAK